MITQAILKERLHYNECTGIFIWISVHENNKKLLGTEAGNLHHSGYINITVNSKIYAAHRLAWLYMKGIFPKAYIDHINGIRNDNRISNLREATKSQNAFNQKARKTSKTGIKGIYWVEAVKKWAVHVQSKNKRFQKRFENFEDAVIAAFNARNELHGEFANHETKSQSNDNHLL